MREHDRNNRRMMTLHYITVIISNLLFQHFLPDIRKVSAFHIEILAPRRVVINLTAVRNHFTRHRGRRKKHIPTYSWAEAKNSQS